MANFLTRHRISVLGPQVGPEAEEIKALSDQFRVTLTAAVNKIEAAGQSGEVLDQIRTLLAKDDWRWKDAYEVEQKVVLFYDEHTLRTELARRIVEAKHVLYPDVASWYREQAKEATTTDEQRALLLRLVNDLQWRYTVNEAKLGYVKQITGRTGWIFIFAVVIFIGFLFFFLFAGNSPDKVWSLPVKFLTFLLAAVSGLLGASFSMMASLKTRLESSSINQMKNASSRALLFSRVLVGTGAAMILYFFFESKLLQGAAFPDLGVVDINIVQRALLVVWGFIAGFSEKLVPGLLAKTEARVADQAPTAPHGPITFNAPAPSGAAPPPKPAATGAPPAATAASAGAAGKGKAQDPGRSK